MSAQLGKVTPIALLIGVVGYCCWPYLAAQEAGPAAEGAGKLPEVTAGMLHPVPAAAAGRDPFRSAERVRAPATAKRPASSAAQAAKTPAPEADTPQLLGGLRLYATYIRGERRLALIDGSVYAEGEPVKGARAMAAPFVVVRVDPDKVLLRRLGQTVELRYAARPAAAGSSAQARAAAAARDKVSGRNGGR